MELQGKNAVAEKSIKRLQKWLTNWSSKLFAPTTNILANIANNYRVSNLFRSGFGVSPKGLQQIFIIGS